MKKYIYPLLAILMLPTVLTSCFKDEEEVEVSESCYISAVSLGNLKRNIYGYTSKGMDSIYTTTFAGSHFPMTIDQRRLTIENKDSLPTRTRLKDVPLTVTFTGALVWRKADVTHLTDTTWTTYNSSDSLDLTEPIHLRVYSLSGKSSRTYTLKVNVHQQNGDSTVWNDLGEVNALDGLNERKVLTWNGQLTVIALDSEQKPVSLTHPLSAEGEWTKQALTGADDARPSTLQKVGNALYMLTDGMWVITSQDGVNWEPMKMEETMTEWLTLVGGSDDYLYAMTPSGLVRSRVDNGTITWKAEKLDDEVANLPMSELNSAYYTQTNGMKRLTLIGSRSDGDTEATIWAKAWEEGQEEQEGWLYYTPNPADKYRCPILENLCVVPYDDGIQALGGKSRNGQYAALEHVFHSSDHGITWKTYENDDMEVDPKLQAAAKDAKHISATVDEENFLWIVADKNVWRGRINRLGFQKK